MKKLLRRLSSSRHDVPRMRGEENLEKDEKDGRLRPTANRQESSPAVVNGFPAGLTEKVNLDDGAEMARRKSEPLPSLPLHSPSTVNGTNDSEARPPPSTVVPQLSSAASTQSPSKQKPVPASSPSLVPPPPPEDKTLPLPRQSHELPSLPVSPITPVEDAAIAGGLGLYLDAVRSQPGPDGMSISPSQRSAPASPDGAMAHHDAGSTFNERPLTEDEVAHINEGPQFTKKEIKLDATGK